MAAPLFRRGDVIGQKYYVLTKSGEAALWVGFLACTVDAQQAAESRGEVPEPDLLLKVVRPELLDSPGAADKLVRHLQQYKELSHPFLAQIVDVMTLPEQNSALVAEVSQVGQGGQGVLLDRMAVFRQKEGLPLADVLQIIDQLAEALTYLHEQGRLHGDLRLDSVLLKTDGVRLGDVGLGMGLPREPFLLLLANVGQMDSVAPELHAARPPDLRTDVFGLARMMRSLLELGDNWPIIRDSNQQLVEVISRALSTDPADRQPSISALIGELEKAFCEQQRDHFTPLGCRISAAGGDLGRIFSVHAAGHGRVWRPAHRRAQGNYCSVVPAADHAVPGPGPATAPALETCFAGRPAQFRHSVRMFCLRAPAHHHRPVVDPQRHRAPVWRAGGLALAG